MNKEEYNKKLTEFDAQISKISALKTNLKIEYINANKPFDIGQKVKVIKNTQNQFGFIRGYEVDYNYEIKPVIYKMKKDGTESQIRLYVWYDDKIEKAE